MHRSSSVAAVIVLLVCLVSIPDAHAANRGGIRGDSCTYLYRLWSVANVTDAIIATYQDAVTRDDSSYRTAVLAQINSAIKDKEGVMDLLQSLKTEFHVSRGHNVYWLPFHSLTFAARHLDIAATTAVTDPQAENATSEFGAAQKSMKHTWTGLNRIPCS
ncbi:MAG: hypothetical protein NVS4B2_14740 [Chloroflexota bacterium]